MIDAIASVLRLALAAIGLLAVTDPVATGSFATVAVALLALALVIVATGAATGHSRGRGSPPHPTRHSELCAPLAQSDPDAAGHVRRRGPGYAVTAA